MRWEGENISRIPGKSRAINLGNQTVCPQGICFFVFYGFNQHTDDPNSCNPTAISLKRVTLLFDAALTASILSRKTNSQEPPADHPGCFHVNSLAGGRFKDDDNDDADDDVDDDSDDDDDGDFWPKWLWIPMISPLLDRLLGAKQTTLCG